MKRLCLLIATLSGPACLEPTFEARLGPPDATAPRDAGAEPADASCRPECGGHACGPDGCGGTCGACRPLESCTQGACVPCPAARRCGAGCCAPDSVCRNGACIDCGCGGRECGEDACGNPCGACAAPTTCNPVLGVCEGCFADCRTRSCGDDGCGGSCGSCPPDLGCVDGQCVGCPADCSGRECGEDGCGGSCGSCAPGLSCVLGRCSDCAPHCSGRRCGDDGCGGECGGCAPDAYCNANGACVPHTCSPGCSPLQRCDLTSFPPVCVELCNPPVGCLAPKRCDPATGQCGG